MLSGWIVTVTIGKPVWILETLLCWSQILKFYIILILRISGAYSRVKKGKCAYLGCHNYIVLFKVNVHLVILNIRNN